MRPTRTASLARPLWLAAVALGALWLGAACGDLDADGAPCTASQACASGLCYANLCRDRAADDDGDGLDNATEHALGLHPDLVDSDGDGLSDGDEVGDPLAPADRDGDGHIDALESSFADADLDCLPDVIDADDAVANDDVSLLVALVCRTEGLCAGQGAQIVAACDQSAGTLTCDYAGVPGYRPDDPCDGVDNNCDGAVDEGHLFAGTPLGGACVGTGACGAGVVECRGGVATCSSNPGGSDAANTAETCNGLDDDCDGAVDEGFALQGIPVGAPCFGTGECGVGVVTCVDSAPLCSTDPGGPDEGAEPERCDGLDNDCDGATDEGLSFLGAALGEACAGVGACGPGTVVCGAGAVAVCSTHPDGPDSAALPETCNGQDDDCDGETDEGFAFVGRALGTACVGLGACGPGTVVCHADGGATCSTMTDGPADMRSPELCNGVDDDCDGAVDDGFEVGLACDGLGACGVGVVECTAEGAARCSTEAGGSAAQDAAEVCNGLDDDCDGLVDDAPDPFDAPLCPQAGICASAAISPVCAQGGVWSCPLDSVPTWEPDEQTCDGLDNDCDGQIDEGLALAWAVTPADLGGVMGLPLQEAASCQLGEALYVVGGLGPASDGGLALSTTLWRLQLSDGRWQRVAVDPAFARRAASLVCLAESPAGGEALWLLGGWVQGDAQPVADLRIEPATGAVSALPPARTPSWRAGARALVQPGLQRLWLLGGQAAVAGAPDVQLFDLVADAWLAEANAPQPAAAWGGAVAACGRQDGRVMVLSPPQGSGSAHTLWSMAPVSLAWSATEALLGAPAAGGWQELGLVCDVAGVDMWALGGFDAAGAASGLWQGADLDATWTLSSGDGAASATVAALRAPHIARHGDSLVLVGGRDAAGAARSATYAGPPWQRRQAAPPAALGAMWISQGGSMFRIGGLEPRGAALAADAATWRHDAAGWSAIGAPPASQGRAAGSVVLSPDGKSAWVWGGHGVVAKPGDVADPSIAPLAGAARVVLGTGVWLPLSSALADKLPPPMVGAAAAQSGQLSWYFGRPGPDAPAALWQLQLDAGPTATLLWDAAGAPANQPAPPAPSTQLAMSHAAPDDALWLWQAGPLGLSAWRFELAAGVWTFEGEVLPPIEALAALPTPTGGHGVFAAAPGGTGLVVFSLLGAGAPLAPGDSLGKGAMAMDTGPLTALAHEQGGWLLSSLPGAGLTIAPQRASALTLGCP